jgi:hypothetical protein
MRGGHLADTLKQTPCSCSSTPGEYLARAQKMHAAAVVLPKPPRPHPLPHPHHAAGAGAGPSIAVSQLAQPAQPRPTHSTMEWIYCMADLSATPICSTEEPVCLWCWACCDLARSEECLYTPHMRNPAISVVQMHEHKAWQGHASLTKVVAVFKMRGQDWLAAAVRVLSMQHRNP